MRDRAVSQGYWINPPEENQLYRYFGSVNAGKRSQYLVGLINKYADKNDHIFELGCNVGRNLSYLINAGFDNVSGLEINPRAAKVAKFVLQKPIICGALEDKIDEVPQFDIVFTMAVMMHIHPSSIDFIERLIKKSRKLVITIEDETSDRARSFAKDYLKIARKCEFDQVQKDNHLPGLNNRYVARVFEKRT